MIFNLEQTTVARMCASNVLCATVCAGFLLGSGPAVAFNGIFLTGYGVEAAGMGGASIAFPRDSVAAANNPAGMSFIGSRVDGGLGLIFADETANFLIPSNSLRGDVTIPVPNFGFNTLINDRITVGLSLYGAGLRTSFGRPLIPHAGFSNAMASLNIAIVAPTISWRFADNWSLGVSIQGGIQTIDAQGVLVPGPQGPQELPSFGPQNAFGYGARFGILGHLNSWLSIGATFNTKMRYGVMNGYENGLLSNSRGRIDLPWIAGSGFALHFGPSTTFAADYLYLAWDNATAFGDMAGFGWRGQHVARFGVAHQLTPEVTARAGFSYASEIIRSSYTNQNILTFGAIGRRSASVGLSYGFGKAGTAHVAFEYVIPETLRGTGPSSGTDLRFSANVLTFGYSIEF